MCESWWSCYEQIAVILSLVLALVTVGVAFLRSKLPWAKPFVVSLTWDFSRSWASNVSGLSAIIGVATVSAVSTDFKPFTQSAVKGSYTVTTALMAAIVVAAPSVYTLLQEVKAGQMVGCVGGFIAASMLTIWGTTAQLLLQGALLIAFVLEKPGSRYALLLVPLVLLVGLVLLFPYALKSIHVALAMETTEPATPKQLIDQSRFEVRRAEAVRADTWADETGQAPRKVALL